MNFQAIETIAQTAKDRSVDTIALRTIVEIVQVSKDIDLQKRSIPILVTIARENADVKLLRAALQSLRKLAAEVEEADSIKAIVRAAESIVQSVPMPENPNERRIWKNLEKDTIDLLGGILQRASGRGDIQLVTIGSLREIGADSQNAEAQNAIIVLMEQSAQHSFDKRTQQESINVIVAVARRGDRARLQGQDALNRLKTLEPDLRPLVDSALREL